MKKIVVPILLITIGVGWLLTTLEVIPEVDWIWTLGIALVGVLAFAIGGFDKVTVVVGTFFLIASGLSIFRQTGRIAIHIEIPVLLIVAGILMLVAQLRIIPIPKWVRDSDEKSQSKR